MRVVRLTDLAFVIRISRKNEVVVVVPDAVPPATILALARLVLSGEEYAELLHHLFVEYADSRH